MYLLKDYARMIGDKARLRAYRRALKQVITPKSVVADIGAGTGIFALEACKLGARKVYAVDTADAIAVAAATAEANGFKDRLVCLQGDSRQIDPPERVDVVVTDVRGALPLFPGSLETTADAKLRWLKRGGTLIPLREVLRVAPVRSPRLYSEVTGTWRRRADGLDLRPALRWALNQWLKSRVQPRELASPPQTWGTVEYGRASSVMSNTLMWPIKKTTTVHGFSLWFESELIPGVRMATGPGTHYAIYTHAFFPTEQPLQLGPGDRIKLALSVHLAQEYLWTWATQVMDRDGKTRAEMRQSSFLSQMIGPATVRKRSAAHRAGLNEDGMVLLKALRAMQAGQSVEEVARELLRDHDEVFDADFERALAFAADVSERHST